VVPAIPTCKPRSIKMCGVRRGTLFMKILLAQWDTQTSKIVGLPQCYSQSFVGKSTHLSKAFGCSIPCTPPIYIYIYIYTVFFIFGPKLCPYNWVVFSAFASRHSDIKKIWKWKLSELVGLVGNTLVDHVRIFCPPDAPISPPHGPQLKQNLAILTISSGKFRRLNRGPKASIGESGGGGAAS